MFDEITERGTWITIHPKNGYSVSGWLIGRIPQGVLVALDDLLTDVRLISEYDQASWGGEKRHPTLHYPNAHELREQLREINASLTPHLKKVFDRLRYDRYHAFSHKSAMLQKEIRTSESILRESHRLDETNMSNVAGLFLSGTHRTIDLHREVFDDFEAAGLAEIVAEYGPSLARLPVELTLPADDLRFQEREDLTSTLEKSREYPWKVEQHLDLLARADLTSRHLLIDALETPREPELPQGQAAYRASFLSRWIGPAIRVLAGTGLATANTALGITAGLTRASFITS